MSQAIGHETHSSVAAGEPATRPRRQPHFAVIIENDDYHTFAYVIEAVEMVCGLSTERAYQLVLEAHTKGRAAVWTGALEVAELKRDQLRGFGPDLYASRPVTFPLGVTVEPLPLS